MAQLLVVEIVDAAVKEETRAGNTFRSQTAYMNVSPRESMEIELSVNRGSQGYAPGKYYLGAKSFDRDRYHRLTLRPFDIELIPVSAAK